jgi:hypothetical protein
MGCAVAQNRLQEAKDAYQESRAQNADLGQIRDFRNH